MQLILPFLVASAFVFATDSKPVEEGFQSDVWVIDPALRPDSKEIKEYEHPSHFGAWLASHRTAKAAKIALALQNIGCLPSPSVSVFDTNPFQAQKEFGDRYQIKSKNCLVKEKSENQCDRGFNPRKISEEGLEGYIVCVKAVPSVPANQGAGGAQ